MPDETEFSAWSGTEASTTIGADARLGGDLASLAPELTRRIGTILDTIQREADKMLNQARDEAQRQVDDGRREADHLLSRRHRRLNELSDALVERTEHVLSQLEETEIVRQSFGRLLSALAEAADRVAAEARATAALAPSPPPLPPAYEAPPPAPPAYEAPSPPAHASPLPPLFASTIPPAQPPPPVASPRPPVVPPPAPTAPPPTPVAPEAAPAPAEAAGQHPAVDRGWVEARQAAIHMAAAGNTRGQVEAQLRDFLAVSDPGPLLDQVFGDGSTADARVPWAIAPATPLHPRERR